MPKYTNSTAVDITVGANRFPANSSLEIGSYIEGALPAGLTLDSVDPNFNPILVDAKYTAKTGADIAVIPVPASDTKGYRIKFYVESGEFAIRLNDAAQVVPWVVTEGESQERKYVSRVVDNIYIHCVAGGTIYVSIYKL